MNPEIKRKMRELLKLMRKADIEQQNTVLNGFYCSFSWKPMKKYCKECGGEV